MQAKTRQRGTSHWIHDASIEPFDIDWFDPEHWALHGSRRRAGAGRGRCWFVSGELGDWVLRHYQRGGKIAALSREHYLYTGVPRTRAFREWNLLRELHDLGLPVPRPIAAQVRVSGLTYRAALITQAINDSATLAERLQNRRVDDELLARVGACVRRFHDAGVWHADLNAHNVLVDEAGQVHLIDFDRSAWRPGERWASNNLARLRRSLDKLSAQDSGSVFEHARWDALLAGYS